MIETEGLTGAETLLRILSHMGVDRIFSSPGSEWSPVWEAFAKAKAQSEVRLAKAAETNERPDRAN